MACLEMESWRWVHTSVSAQSASNCTVKNGKLHGVHILAQFLENQVHKLFATEIE